MPTVFETESLLLLSHCFNDKDIILLKQIIEFVHVFKLISGKTKFMFTST